MALTPMQAEPFVDRDGKVTRPWFAFLRAITPGVLLTADPASPADDSWWVSRIGTSPAMVVALKVRIDGTTTTVATVTL